MTGHALIVQPSGLHLTMECAASLLMQLMGIPPVPSHEEKEGQAAHWHALQWASGNHMEVGVVFKAAGQEWTVNTDMIAGSKLYALEACLHNDARYEEPIACADIHPDSWGTPDYFRWIPEINMLKVVDYKFGHRYVDAFENWQLIAYALGVIRLLNLPMTANVKLVIVQPRCYFSDSGFSQDWTTTVADLFKYALRIAEQVRIALSPNAPAKTGRHCLDCKARHLCKTLQHNAMHVVEYASVGEMQELDIDALGVEARIVYEAHAILDARLEGLKAQIKHLTDKGQNVPYWIMADGRSFLKWNEGVGVEDIRALGQATGVATIHPSKPITPTQAIDAGVDPTVMTAYATRLPPGKTLKPESTQLARKVFGAKHA